MSYADVYDDFNLFITPEKFYIQPKVDSKCLTIDRISEQITLENALKQTPSSTTSYREFCGLLGTITLLAGKYLIIVTERNFVGNIAGHVIWCLVGIDLIPYNRGTLHLKPEQLDDNNTYLDMIRQVLATPYFYFSYTYDLSHTMQRLNGTGPDFLSQSLLERGESRFIWNNSLFNGFGHEFHKFCLPLIHGFIEINDFQINGYNYSWTLVSRRSIHRAGTRLFRRGIDKQGNVANFVETEMIVECQGDRASFVQVRGSVPLYWTQLPDLRYKPPPRLQDVGEEEQHAACARHFDNLTMLYGKQVLLDLVDQHGSEGKLHREYRNAVQQINYALIRYEPFDFHSECRHMKWERLSILMDRIALEQEEMGFFMLLRDGSLALQQDGVFRTNCVDCLDRTNVVQSLLARRCLTNILRKMSIIQPDETVERYSLIEQKFKNVWADHADLISIQYSGTGALKTDFTRTGKRTHLGLLRDGMNSLIRYYKNNLSDGYRQDALDVFLGVAEIQSPLKVQRGWKYITFLSVFLVAFAMFIACAVLPSEYSTDSLTFMLFWGIMVVATFSLILRHGSEFVDKPRLTYMQ
ncbi:hypothetical protein FQR65_LT04493 [Abscondita terminalis]|nr:hypothetical protein FQR65_LT04493 [Abscondita terminalis]